MTECLNGLPGDQKQSVVLAYYQGLSHSELAEDLQQPTGTVKSWLRRALAHLKDVYGNMKTRSHYDTGAECR